LTRDPLGYVDGMNMAGYANVNPQNNIDPEGLKNKVVVITSNTTSNDYDKWKWRLTYHKINKVNSMNMMLTELEKYVEKHGKKIDELYVSGHAFRGGVSFDGYTDKKSNRSYSTRHFNAESLTKIQVNRLKNVLDEKATLHMYSCGSGGYDKEIKNLVNLIERDVVASLISVKSGKDGNLFNNITESIWFEFDPQGNPWKRYSYNWIEKYRLNYKPIPKKDYYNFFSPGKINLKRSLKPTNPKPPPDPKYYRNKCLISKSNLPKFPTSLFETKLQGINPPSATDVFGFGDGAGASPGRFISE